VTTLTTNRPARGIAVPAIFIAAVIVVALIGVLGVQDTSETYQNLQQPGWAPPSWSSELLPYAVQLVLNAIWTPLFFGAGHRGLALVEICLLWLAIGWTAVSFRRVRPLAASRDAARSGCGGARADGSGRRLRPCRPHAVIGRLRFGYSCQSWT
jgi:translocator protein